MMYHLQSLKGLVDLVMELDFLHHYAMKEVSISFIFNSYLYKCSPTLQTTDRSPEPGAYE